MRWAVLITVVVVLIIGLIRACEGGSAIDVTAYVDSVRPLIQTSNEIGEEFKLIPPGLENLSRDQLSQRLDDLARRAAELAGRAETIFTTVPTFAIPAHGFLLTTFQLRAVGLSELKPAILQANLIPEDQEQQAFITFRNALTGLLLADQSYQFFSERVKAELTKAKQKAEVPDSFYVRDTDLGRTDRQEDFVRRVRSAESLKAAKNLTISSFKTQPDSVNQDGETYHLPPSEVFELIVSVTNKGNVRAEQVQVQARLTSSINPTPRTSSVVFDVIEPGGTKQEVVRGLIPDRGDPVNLIELEVQVSDDVDITDNADSFKFTMARS